MKPLKLNQTQRDALKKAMRADLQQEMINACTPDRGYAFPMDHTLAIVERILNAPATRKHHASAEPGIPSEDWDHIGCAACRGSKVLGCEPWHILMPCLCSRKSSDAIHELNRVDPPAKRWARFCEEHSLPNH